MQAETGKAPHSERFESAEAPLESRWLRPVRRHLPRWMVTIQRSRRSSKPAPSSIVLACRCCAKRSSPNSELFGRQLTTRSSTRSSTTRFGEPALMGTDGNAIAGASEPRCVTGDRFEDRITKAEPMVPLPTPEAVVVTRRKPRHALAPMG